MSDTAFRKQLARSRWERFWEGFNDDTETIVSSPSLRFTKNATVMDVLVLFQMTTEQLMEALSCFACMMSDTREPIPQSSMTRMARFHAMCMRALKKHVRSSPTAEAKTKIKELEQQVKTLTTSRDRWRSEYCELNDRTTKLPRAARENLKKLLQKDFDDDDWEIIKEDDDGIRCKFVKDVITHKECPKCESVLRYPDSFKCHYNLKRKRCRVADKVQS